MDDVAFDRPVAIDNSDEVGDDESWNVDSLVVELPHVGLLLSVELRVVELLVAELLDIELLAIKLLAIELLVIELLVVKRLVVR